MPQRPAGRTGENQGGGLRRPVEVAGTRQLGQGPFNPDRACPQVNVAATKRRQLTPPETAENRNENQRTVPRSDRVGQGGDLAHGQDRSLR